MRRIYFKFVENVQGNLEKLADNERLLYRSNRLICDGESKNSLKTTTMRWANVSCENVKRFAFSRLDQKSEKSFYFSIWIQCGEVAINISQLIHIRLELTVLIHFVWVPASIWIIGSAVRWWRVLALPQSTLCMTDQEKQTNGDGVKSTNWKSISSVETINLSDEPDCNSQSTMFVYLIAEPSVEMTEWTNISGFVRCQISLVDLSTRTAHIHPQAKLST